MRVNWHANVCAQLFIVPAHLLQPPLPQVGIMVERQGPGLAGGYGPGDTQPWLLLTKTREVAWATTTVATALGLRLSRQPPHSPSFLWPRPFGA